MKSSVREELDRIEETGSSNYDRFQYYGEDFIYELEAGLSQISMNWASANDLLEESDYRDSGFKQSDDKDFAGIFNLLCSLELLPAHDSDKKTSHVIHTDDYDREPVIEAYEYVSGEEFTEREDVSKVDPGKLYPSLQDKASD